MENQQMRVGLDNSTPIVCESCSNSTFKEASYLRKISRLLTGSAEDMIVPVPTFICTKCGHVNEQFQIKEPKKPDTIIK
jgi:uncharacterized Zn finger protein